MAQELITAKIVLGAGISAISVLVGWIFKRQINRIDELEKNSVRKERLSQALTDIEKDINLIRHEIEQGRAEFREEHQITRQLMVNLNDKFIKLIQDVQK